MECNNLAPIRKRYFPTRNLTELIQLKSIKIVNFLKGKRIVPKNIKIQNTKI